MVIVGYRFFIKKTGCERTEKEYKMQVLGNPFFDYFTPIIKYLIS